MPYNVDLMLQVREQITAYPETHDQDSYESNYGCGTTRCIAGWAIFFHKGVQESIYEGRSEDSHPWRYRDSDGIAAELLGLDDDEADSLFHCMDDDRAVNRLDALIEKGKNQ